MFCPQSGLFVLGFFFFALIGFRLSAKSEESRLQKADGENPGRSANPLFKMDENLKC